MFSKSGFRTNACVCFFIVFLLMFGACSKSSANAAVFIYAANDVNRESPVASIYWEDKDKLIVINQMINEMYDTAGKMSEEIEMSYIIEFVNNGAENDIFEIGIDGERICGKGEVQGVTIDGSYTTSVTSEDFMNAIQENKSKIAGARQSALPK